MNSADNDALPDSTTPEPWAPAARSHTTSASDHLVVGAVLSLVAAVGYTATNVCLRDLSRHVDPFWVSCVKAVPTVVLASLMLLGRVWRGLPIGMSRRTFLIVASTAVVVQLVGNVGFQWSLSIVGMALAVPLTHGTLMIGGAVLGRIVLGEAVSTRAVVAMIVLLVAIAELAIGAHQAQSTTAGAAALHSDQPPLSTLTISLGVAVTCMAGVAYGLLGVVIRGTVGNTAPMSSMLLVICTTGVVVLGGASLRTIGPAGMLATAPADWAMMLLAGTFNAVAFLALTKALHLTNVVRVNLINGSQNAMAAVAGVLIFGEPWTIWLGLGVALTLVGLAMMRRK